MFITIRLILELIVSSASTKYLVANLTSEVVGMVPAESDSIFIHVEDRKGALVAYQVSYSALINIAQWNCLAALLQLVWEVIPCKHFATVSAPKAIFVYCVAHHANGRALQLPCAYVAVLGSLIRSTAYPSSTLSSYICPKGRRLTPRNDFR